MECLPPIDRELELKGELPLLAKAFSLSLFWPLLQSFPPRHQLSAYFGDSKGANGKGFGGIVTHRQCITQVA